MAKLNLPDIGTLANNASARQAINDNFAAIEEALDDTLSRAGTAPNQMEADIDLNSNDLLNVKRIDAAEFYKNGQPWEQSVTYGEVVADIFSGNGVQTSFPLSSDPGSIGNLDVSIAGVTKRPGLDYVLSGTNIQFVVPPASATNNVLVRYAKAVPTGITSASALTYVPPQDSIPTDVKSFLDRLYSNSSTQGGNLIRFSDSVAPAYLKTVSDIINGEPVSVFRNIDKTKWAGIRAGSNADDLYNNFNDLLVNMGAQGYGLLEVPRGAYTINTTLPVPSGITIRGEGRYATTLKWNGITNGLRLGNGSGAHDLCIDGLNVSQTGIHADAASRVLVSGVLIQNLLFHGLAITNCVGGQFSDVRVLNCQQRGVIIDPNSYDNQLTNIYTENCTNAGLLIGHNSHHNQVRNFTAINTGNVALWIHNASYKNEVSGVVIRGTTAGAGTPGILLGYNSQDNIVSDFSIEGYTIGAVLRGAAADPTYTLGDTARNLLTDGRLMGTGSGVANSTAILFDSTDAGVTKAVDNIIDNVIASNYQYGLREAAANSALNNDINGGRFQADITTPYSMTGTSGTRAYDVRGITGIGNLGGSTPAFPATNVAVTNTFPFPVQIFIAGMPNAGTRVIQINGVNTAASPAPGDGNQPHTLLPGQTITPFYGAGTPSWTWFGL